MAGFGASGKRILQYVTKDVTDESDLDPNRRMKKCLGTTDLMFKGVGSMIGGGIFVMAGDIIKLDAGPAAVMSYFVASLAAMLSALCFAEFAPMIPLAGTTVKFTTYLIIIETWAFLDGWNLLLEYGIITSLAAKSCSGTLDTLLNGTISRGIEDKVGSFQSVLADSRPDLVALLIILLVTLFVVYGPLYSSLFNLCLVSFKMLSLVVVIIIGFMHADISNWTATKGGFFPTGFMGTFKGAAASYFAFIGFDSIAISIEETKNPRKTLPRAIIGSMSIVIVLYMSSIIMLTLLVPWYKVDPESPFPKAFAEAGIPWMVWVVGVGIVIGLATVTLSGIFAIPRIIYGMARNGFIFSAFAYINPKTETPLLPIALTTVMCGVLATFINLHLLEDLLTIGTLLSFTFVVTNVIMLRFTETAVDGDELGERRKKARLLGIDPDTVNDFAQLEPSEETRLLNMDDGEPVKLSCWQKYKQFTKYSKSSFKKATVCVVVLVIHALTFLLTLIHLWEHVKVGTWWVMLIMAVTAAIVILDLLILWSLEQAKVDRGPYKVPLYPFLPGMSIILNLGLMLMLPWTSWVRLVLWLGIGSVIVYFGIKNTPPPPDDY